MGNSENYIFFNVASSWFLNSVLKGNFNLYGFIIIIIIIIYSLTSSFLRCALSSRRISILFSIMSSSKKSSTLTKKLFSFLNCFFLLMEIFIEASLGCMKAIYFIN